MEIQALLLRLQLEIICAIVSQQTINSIVFCQLMIMISMANVVTGQKMNSCRGPANSEHVCTGFDIK